MKILVAVDSSGSFAFDDVRWDNIKKIVNETVNSLSKNAEVEIVKVRYDELVPCTLEEFSEGWVDGDGGGLNETLLNGLDYDKVLFVTDGFIDVKALDEYVSLMILEDPAYVEDPNPIVGFICQNCGKEKSQHQAAHQFCQEKKGYFSNVNKFDPDLTLPVRRFTI